MTDSIRRYRAATDPLPSHYRLWPLYGAGLENLGDQGRTISRPMPTPAPDQLLVRHDAVGICFSDIKVIRAGQNHPRIYRDMRQDPVVLGHEVSMTVVAVGRDLADQYRPGDRFIIQADIYVDGVSYAYGYEIQGGFSQYNLIDKRILAGDHGNYLIPIPPDMGYAEAALNEPWACVEASYTVTYRTHWRPDGCVWIDGDGRGIQLGAARDWRPGRVFLSATDGGLRAQIQQWATDNNIPVSGAPGQEPDDAATFDDIVLLNSDPSRIEAAARRLDHGGMLAVIGDAPMSRRVSLDIGRLHYDHQAWIGATGPDLSAAYAPIRTQLLSNGQLWILGAGGPMGHMHLQRALEIADRPATVVATNLRRTRIEALQDAFAQPAQAAGVALTCLSADEFAQPEAFAERLFELTQGQGFDDLAVMAPSVEAIESALPLLARGAVVNVFAGLPRGTQAAVDYDAIVRQGIRFTGTSGSSIDDLCAMRDLTQAQRLSPNRSVVAVAGLEGVPDGLAAVAEGRFPGKVVIYPNLSKPLPLTPLADLAEPLPQVYAALEAGRAWTNAAEEALLGQLLSGQHNVTGAPG